MFSTISVCPGFISPQKLNPVEPPWYGPVCLVVWEGRRREASPYPDHRPKSTVLERGLFGSRWMFLFAKLSIGFSLGRASVSLALNPPIYFMLAPVVRLQ
jgi:hypothetical protein